MSRKKSAVRKAAMSSNCQLVSVAITDVFGWHEREVMVAIPMGETIPGSLIMLSQKYSNQVYCRATGRVFQQTNARYEWTGRAIDTRIIERAMATARWEIEETYLTGCWETGLV